MNVIIDSFWTSQIQPFVYYSAKAQSVESVSFLCRMLEFYGQLSRHGFFRFRNS